MSGAKVVITDCDLGPVDVEREVLEASGCHVELAKCRSPDDVVAVGRDADALIVQWAPITADVIGQLERCQIISRYGIGLDNIDVEAASAAGIAVANVADYCLEEVASHATALIYAVIRQLVTHDRDVRTTGWSRPTRAVRRLSTSTVGLVGLGRTGRMVARSMAATGATLVAHDPAIESGADAVELVDFEQLLGRSDIISLHCPLTASTRHLINADTLRMMKPTSVVVNTARGGLIDETALARALDAGQLAGAGLDVFETEPLPQSSALRRLDNVVLTPHVAWYSESSLPALQRGAAQNVVAFFAGEATRVVNGVEPRGREQ